MKSLRFTSSLIAAVLALGTASAARAALIISEVYAAGSSNSTNNTYGADWFELTNTGTSAVDITGYTVDDASASFGSSLALNGVTTIEAGQSVIFIEGSSTTASSFVSAWFGTAAPSGFTIGTYSGSGVGLSTGGDAVNIYDSVGTLVVGVTFGSSSAGATFDNATGASGTISTLSAVGTNGAFTSANGAEVGSPGVIAATAIPEPSAFALLAGVGSLALVSFRRRSVPTV